MASATKKSLVSRAGAAARKVVARGAGSSPKAAKTAAKPGEKSSAKSAAKKPSTKKTVKKTAKKAPSDKTAAKPASARKTAAAKKTATKNAHPKATASKAAPKKAAPLSGATAKESTVTTSKAPAKKAAAAKGVPIKAATNRAPSAKTAPTNAAKLLVLEAEDPWTKSELKEVRAQLNDDVKRLTGELAEVEGDLAGMIENSGEGAGHDQADVGSASFERDQEMVIVNNARDMLEQSQHALERIADGTYGKCEVCGNAIGKNRLMAFPRATLCLICKQREERR